ncbi:MAG: hypothetical protein KAH62_06215 [Desulfobacula sp.]|nr:hypothetical protein [Desulfobacula sp.]
MISISYKIKFTIIGALIVPCFGRIALHGTNSEYDLYRYFVPLIVGGLSGYFIGMMKDKWFATNKNLNKANKSMKQEIKEHKLSRQALQKSKGQSKRYIEAIDSMGISIFIVDSDYQIRHMNKTMIKWFGDHIRIKLPSVNYRTYLSMHILQVKARYRIKPNCSLYSYNTGWSLIRYYVLS